MELIFGLVLQQTPIGDDTNCDGIDDNCDGHPDNNYVATPTTCGLGGCASTGEMQCINGQELDTCQQGTSSEEICDGIDNDCDGTIPNDELDKDNDGFMACDDDCNDNKNDIYPGAPELCDNKDNDCDGIKDNDCHDVSISLVKAKDVTGKCPRVKRVKK